MTLSLGLGFRALALPLTLTLGSLFRNLWSPALCVALSEPRDNLEDKVFGETQSKSREEDMRPERAGQAIT